MKAHQAVFSVETGPPVRMCKVLHVSRSGYYYWLARHPSKRVKETETILKLINVSFTASKGRYGSPKITQDLSPRRKGVPAARSPADEEGNYQKCGPEEICGHND